MWHSYRSSTPAIQKALLLTLISMVLLPHSVATQELVTRDDFIFYDTTHPRHHFAAWPMIAMDEEGMIAQINYVVDAYDVMDITQFNLFDRFGNQLQPVHEIIPDTTIDTLPVEAAGWVKVCGGNAGYFVPYRSKWDELVLAKEIGPDGKPEQGAICLLYGTDTTFGAARVPDGDANNLGEAVTTWEEHTGAVDSVQVRQYFFANDSIGPRIAPLDYLWPPGPGWPDFYHIHLGTTVATNDSGRFVVCWCGPDRIDHTQRVLFIVFDKYGQPVTTITLAECIGQSKTGATNCNYDYPNVATATMESDGDFYIAWWGSPAYDEPTHHTRWHIYMRGFYADGSPKYEPLRVNDSDSTNNWDIPAYPRIACDDEGNVLITWSDSRLHPESSTADLYYDVYAQKIDAEGNLVGPNYRLNNKIGRAGPLGIHYDCDMNNDGQAAFIWLDVSETRTVYGQLMPYDRVGRFVPGDLDFDLQATVADLSLLVGHIFQGDKNPFWPRILGDINGDSAIAYVSDLTYLVDYFFTGGPEPISPDEGIRPPTPWPHEVVPGLPVVPDGEDRPGHPEIITKDYLRARDFNSVRP